MERNGKIATALVAAAGLALAAAAHAHPGMGGGMGAGMGPDGKGCMGGQGGIAAQLMTSEEHTALMEKMHAAKTPQERRALAEQTHEQMQKRAAERGITLPEHRGPMGNGPFR